MARVSDTRRLLAGRIARVLRANRAVRDPQRDARNASPLLAPLQRWQAQRLAGSFEDLLADPASAPAARFFLSDLYGDHDVSGRDRDIERVMPLMQRLLSPAMLGIAADAMQLAVLSHAFDLRMAAALQADGGGSRLDAGRYAAAYRAVDRARLRDCQLRLTERVGAGLAQIVHTPAVAQLLRLARLPARAAGLYQLQSFLERGFTAFGRLPDAHAFVAGIVASEREVMRRLFAGHPHPFAR